MAATGAKSLFIDGQWREGRAGRFVSVNPANGQAVWEGRAADVQQVNEAVAAARAVAADWADTPPDERLKFLEAFAAAVKADRDAMAELISSEVGKPLWESLTEVDAMAGKVPLSIQAFHERRQVVEKESGGATAVTRYKPHGVVAVFGPFNLPGHLPNGHIVPALLAGNTVVFKPSELTPAVGQRMVELWEKTGLPKCVVNLVQGAKETGAALAAHPGIDGILFTGSVAVGKALNRAAAEHPEKILALEMGGNNPLVVWDVADVEAAAYQAVLSAFITSGQRCTCARRLIVTEDRNGEAHLGKLVEMSGGVRVGAYTDRPEPFMGPVVSEGAGAKVLAAYEDLVRRGAKPLLAMKTVGRKAMLTPGIVDVTGLKDRSDEEVFGPLLQVIRVPDFDAAVREANNTAYGLAAGLLSDSRELYESFFRRIRAGIVNWNRQTTGASGALPFGGVGLSGNHRPSGFWAADYCSYPVASLEAGSLTMPQKLLPGVKG
jgi:succinylglutamic semialdehyde dehydrogenase